jgi:methylthioribose-1-phosphate isomerase
MPFLLVGKYKICDDFITLLLILRNSGADQVAENGDTANKIGTHSLSILAKHNNIPFYVVTPTSSINLGIPNGSQIRIEERPAEVFLFGG